MIQSPKSLTATVHVRFHYAEPETKPLSEGETQMIADLLEHVTDLEPELQEILIKFASHLKTSATGKTSR